MARDVMTVRLHLAQIRVLEVVEDTPGALVVSVESTFSCGCAARSAGSSCHRVHDRRDKRVPGPGGVGAAHDCWCGQRRRMACEQLRQPVLGGTSGLRGRAHRAFVAAGRR